MLKARTAKQAEALLKAEPIGRSGLKAEALAGACFLASVAAVDYRFPIALPLLAPPERTSANRAGLLGKVLFLHAAHGRSVGVANEDRSISSNDPPAVSHQQADRLTVSILLKSLVVRERSGQIFPVRSGQCSHDGGIVRALE